MTQRVVPLGADNAAVLHGLVRKRAEFAGELAQLSERARGLAVAIAHVDAVLELLNPDVRIDGIKPKRFPRPYAAEHGEVTAVLIEALREADTPRTSRGLTQELMRARGLDESDGPLESLMAKRVRSCLKMHRAKGRVRFVSGDRTVQGWVLVGGTVDKQLRRSPSL